MKKTGSALSTLIGLATIEEMFSRPTGHKHSEVTPILGHRQRSFNKTGTGNNELQKHYTPPRSMTPEEQEYYDRNKNLNGFYNLARNS